MLSMIKLQYKFVIFKKSNILYLYFNLSSLRHFNFVREMFLNELQKANKF